MPLTQANSRSDLTDCFELAIPIFHAQNTQNDSECQVYYLIQNSTPGNRQYKLYAVVWETLVQFFQHTIPWDYHKALNFQGSTFSRIASFENLVEIFLHSIPVV